MTLKSDPALPARLAAQLAFLGEADRLKSVLRANELMDGTRFENSAEHSWHAMLAALLFAPLATAEVDLDRALAMLLLHDLVEIDAGDHPIHLFHDPASVAALETRAADRLFGLLPRDQNAAFRALWEEFEAMESPTARYAKSIDYLTPALQTLGGQPRNPDHMAIVGRNLREGRATKTESLLPPLYAFTCALYDGAPTDPDLARRYALFCEADRLKGIERATKALRGARFENSAEHSWHICLYALTLAEFADPHVAIARVIRMLILHDLVEVDAGDNPIHGDVDHSAQEAAEQAAADRLFGLLPAAEGAALHALWTEFETAETPDARFAKSIDRVQAPLLNLEDDGGSWRTYNVTLAQLDTRVGSKIARGAPDLWPHIRAHVAPWFVANNAL